MMESIQLPRLLKRRQKSLDSIPEKLALGRVFAEVNKKIISGVEYRRLLDYIFNSLNLTIPYDRIGVALLEKEGDDSILRLTWVRSKLGATELPLYYSAPLKGSSLEPLIKEAKPRIINDLVAYYADHPQSHSTSRILKDGIRSSLTCPLKIDNRSIGVVFFSHRRPGTYKEEHVQTFLEIANELALIIEYGRLKKQFSEDSLSRNISTILHDLKSPLSVIQGFAEEAPRQTWYQELNPKAQNIFSVFARNSEKMFSILDGLLEIAELNRQANQYSPQAVDLAAFCFQMTKYGEMLSQSKEIQFFSEYTSVSSDKLLFDRDKIQKALDNLFTNAIKYSPRKGKVFFKVEFSNKKIIFSVRDEGVGIPSQELSKLFKEFGRTSARPTEGESSTGLGLAILKKIVDLHGGEVSVQSSVQQGSTFEFWIPLLVA